MHVLYIMYIGVYLSGTNYTNFETFFYWLAHLLINNLQNNNVSSDILKSICHTIKDTYNTLYFSVSHKRLFCITEKKIFNISLNINMSQRNKYFKRSYIFTGELGRMFCILKIVLCQRCPILLLEGPVTSGQAPPPQDWAPLYLVFKEHQALLFQKIRQIRFFMIWPF